MNTVSFIIAEVKKYTILKNSTLFFFLIEDVNKKQSNPHGAEVYPDYKAWADEYFGDLPAGETPQPVLSREPDQRGERRVEVAFDAGLRANLLDA